MLFDREDSLSGSELDDEEHMEVSPLRPAHKYRGACIVIAVHTCTVLVKEFACTVTANKFFFFFFFFVSDKSKVKVK